MFFFVQSVSADRYNHCRELRFVSLESTYCVKYGFKENIFLEFRVFFAVTIDKRIFAQFFVNFAKIC